MYHQSITIDTSSWVLRLLRLLLRLALLLVVQHGVVVSAWVGASTFLSRRVFQPSESSSCHFFASSPSSFLPSEEEEEAKRLQEKAARLRLEVSQLEQAKQNVQQQKQMLQEQEREAEQSLRNRYAAVVPILRPDGSVQQEQVNFLPYYQDGSSYITVTEASLPLGIVLGESEVFPGAVVVDEIAPESHGEQAGLQVGDVMRAFTACRMQMNQPAWQLMAGGIGIPKTVRFMYAADNQVFEQVMAAIVSNRMDPQGRPVLMVIERQG